MIKAIIFDLDGVIFDSEILHQQAWKKVFERYGIHLTKNDYLKGIGISDLDFLKHLVSEKKIPEDIEVFIKEKRKTLLEISSQAKPIDGVCLFIGELSSEYKLAVASNSDREFVLKLIEKEGLSKCFSVILGFQDISKPKPDPEIYIKCADKLGVLPDECVVFEDSPTGIKAAKNAGMKCIALATTLDENALSEADFIIKKMEFDKVKKFLGF
ncbi:MAG: HAD family phosphatase [bacterium]|nr:HAD family phosphatase [bacterium]